MNNFLKQARPRPGNLWQSEARPRSPPRGAMRTAMAPSRRVLCTTLVHRHGDRYAAPHRLPAPPRHMRAARAPGCHGGLKNRACCFFESSCARCRRLQHSHHAHHSSHHMELEAPYRRHAGCAEEHLPCAIAARRRGPPRDGDASVRPAHRARRIPAHPARCEAPIFKLHSKGRREGTEGRTRHLETWVLSDHS